MRKILFAFCVMLSISVSAQDNSIEKSVKGVQVGVYPLSVYHEMKLARRLALRTELGLGFTFRQFYVEGLLWESPLQVNVEPRYYYNVDRRTKKGKRIDNNSGNYWGLCINYTPGMAFRNFEVDERVIGINIIPSYGIRRNIGRHFNFETAFGFGYGVKKTEGKLHYFYGQESVDYKAVDKGFVTALRLSIGYMFKAKKPVYK